MHPKYIVYNPLFKTISNSFLMISNFIHLFSLLTTIEMERYITGIQQNVFYIILILLISHD